MGLKDAAKKLMADAGVPVTPGYMGENQDPAFLAERAAEIGYPVLIKAVAGGGGKGMRKVDAAADFIDALASCQREARSEEHTSELQSLMRISYAVFCLKNKKHKHPAAI